MLTRFWEKRAIRYIICGVITAAFNIFLIASVIETLKLDTPLLRNVANLGTIEVSVLFSFVVYRIWVWPHASWNLKKIFFHQIPLYHLSSSISIIVRSFILFPFLDWVGFHYGINTLIGILIGAILNYFLSNYIVFRTDQV